MRVMSAWFPIVHWSLRHQPWCSPCCTGFYRADAPAATGPSITNPGEGVKEGAGGLWIRTLVVLFLLVDLDNSLAQVDPGLHVHAVNTDQRTHPVPSVSVSTLHTRYQSRLHSQRDWGAPDDLEMISGPYFYFTSLGSIIQTQCILKQKLRLVKGDWKASFIVIFTKV